MLSGSTKTNYCKLTLSPGEVLVGERGVSTGPWDAENICGQKNRIEDKPVELHMKKMEAPHGVLVLLKQVPNNSTFN